MDPHNSGTKPKIGLGPVGGAGGQAGRILARLGLDQQAKGRWPRRGRSIWRQRRGQQALARYSTCSETKQGDTMQGTQGLRRVDGSEGLGGTWG